MLFFGFALSAIILMAGLFNRRESGFTLEKIRSPFEPSSKWAVDDFVESEKENLREILSQDFNYLGSGAQCYAFLSADGNYVIKFFKIKHLLPKKWLKLIPLPGLDDYRFKKIDRRILRHRELFSSYKIAYEELKKETGLVFIHLNKSKDLEIRAKLYDRMRNCSCINLDDFEFIVQKKAQLVRDRITFLMQRDRHEETLNVIQTLLEQVVVQCKKGFIDRDSGVSHNYGFVGDQVIHFDVGQITRDESAKVPSYYQREVLRIGRKLEDWIEVNYPALMPELEEIIDSMIDPSREI